MTVPMTPRGPSSTSILNRILVESRFYQPGASSRVKWSSRGLVWGSVLGLDWLILGSSGTSSSSILGGILVESRFYQPGASSNDQIELARARQRVGARRRGGVSASTPLFRSAEEQQSHRSQGTGLCKVLGGPQGAESLASSARCRVVLIIGVQTHSDMCKVLRTNTSTRLANVTLLWSQEVAETNYIR